MSKQERIKSFYLDNVFFHALKSLDPKYIGKELQFSFIPPNKLKLNNWSDQKPECKNFQTKVDKILQSISVIKLNQPEKKIQRIKGMRKWKKQFQIQALNIIKVKKSHGNFYYLIGLTSQLNLYQVVLNLQEHSYKIFSTAFGKNLYKCALQCLINCRDYQLLVYDRLKITSTELRFIQSKNKNQRKNKSVEILFQLKKYAATKELVQNYKQILRNQFTICAIVFHQENAEKTKEIVVQSLPKAWKYIQAKEELASIYLIYRKQQGGQFLTQVLEKCRWIQYIKFLKGLGQANQILLPLIQNNMNRKLNENQELIANNFYVRGNSNQKSSQVTLRLKQECSHEKWKEALKYLI